MLTFDAGADNFLLIFCFPDAECQINLCLNLKGCFQKPLLDQIDAYLRAESNIASTIFLFEKINYAYI